jgi:hypothetical protein
MPPGNPPNSGSGGGNRGGGGGGSGGGGDIGGEYAAGTARPEPVETPAEPQQPDPLDLEVLDVRLVDTGDAEQKLGPRFRVFFRNNSQIASSQPFVVALLAANGSEPKAE